MNNQQKTKIEKMRLEGGGYIRIATELGISVNTVKSHCRRHGLHGDSLESMKTRQKEDLLRSAQYRKCRNCDTPVLQIPGRKAKLFCSDKCRNQWWNTHQNQVTRKAYYKITCACCGKTFMVYGNRRRKYCCHACYIMDRFGK